MTVKKISPSEQARLVQVATDAAQKAYAPYSKFRVGAAVLTKNGNIFSGCNIENASYGLTVCAERVGIFSAASIEGGSHLQIVALAVVNDRGAACAPCGACRQVIYEFGPEALIFFKGSAGNREMRITQLLPEGFRLSGNQP